MAGAAEVIHVPLFQIPTPEDVRGGEGAVPSPESFQGASQDFRSSIPASKILRLLGRTVSDKIFAVLNE